MKYKLIIFDLDGTILDTSEGVKGSVIHTINHFNLPPCDNKTLESFVGPPMQESFKRVYGFSSEKADKACQIFREHYIDDNLLKAKIYPGIRNALFAIKENNLKTAVATYKRQDMAQMILEHFGLSGYFDAIRGSDIENSLTKTDLIDECITRTGVTKETSILIGDSFYDAVGAEQARIDFLAVTYGFGFKSKDSVSNFRSVACANDAKGIISYILE